MMSKWFSRDTVVYTLDPTYNMAHEERVVADFYKSEDANFSVQSANSYHNITTALRLWVDIFIKNPDFLDHDKAKAYHMSMDALGYEVPL